MTNLSDTDSLKSRIEKTLGVLVGLPLWAVGRSVDLAWFAFGNRRSVKGWNGVERDVGEYALHVQCPWRITLGDNIITGRGDIFCTPEESAEPLPADFDWQKGDRFDRSSSRLSPNRYHWMSRESKLLTLEDLASGCSMATSWKYSRMTLRAKNTGGFSELLWKNPTLWSPESGYIRND